MNDGTTVLPKLFGLNSHSLGCDESAEVLVNQCVSRTACSTHRTRYSTVFNAENQFAFCKASANANVEPFTTSDMLRSIQGGNGC